MECAHWFLYLSIAVVCVVWYIKGGPLLEVGTHWIFGLLELIGYDSIANIHSVVHYPPDDTPNDEDDKPPLPCEISCAATISLRSGVTATVDIITDSTEAAQAGKDLYEMKVCGSPSSAVGGTAGAEGTVPMLTLYDFTKLRDDANGGVDIMIPEGGHYGRMECVDEFVKAVRSKSREGANLVLPAEARDVQAVITALKEGGR